MPTYLIYEKENEEGRKRGRERYGAKCERDVSHRKKSSGLQVRSELLLGVRVARTYCCSRRGDESWPPSLNLAGKNASSQMVSASDSMKSLVPTPRMVKTCSPLGRVEGTTALGATGSVHPGCSTA